MADSLTFAGGVYYGVDSSVEKDFYYDLSVDYAMELSDSLTLSVGAESGYADPNDGEKGWAVAVADLGLKYTLNRYWDLGASASYIYQMDDEVLLAVDDSAPDYGYDVDLVYKLVVSCRF